VAKPAPVLAPLDGSSARRGRAGLAAALAGTALTVSMLAGACTGGGGATAPGGVPEASGSPAAAAGAVDEDAVRWAMMTSAPPAGMPLEPYYEALRHEANVLGPGLEQAQAERLGKVEEEIARCMAEAGFDYYPQTSAAVPDDPSWSAANEQDSAWLWDRLPVPQLGATREDVAAHGYGRWELMPPSVLDGDDPEDQAAIAELVANDPNAQYLESLSKPAQDAYYKALDAMEPFEGGYMGSSAMPGESGSCRDRAEQLFPNPALTDSLSDYIYQDLVGGMAEIRWQTDDDPRTLALDREWAACMAERGYDVTEVHQVGDGGSPSVTSGPVLAFHLAINTGADGQVADIGLYPNPSLPKDQRSMIQSEPEKAVALADFDCRGQTDYMARLTQIQLELETAFVEDNRQALDELLAAIERNIAEG
jgi:hypothetical protein